VRRIVRWLGFGHGHVERADRSSLLMRSVRGGHVVCWCGVGCRMFGGVVRWAWYIFVRCVVAPLFKPFSRLVLELLWC
jgi:hypothetical protein